MCVTASLRLIRKVIGLKDDFYNRYIIKGDLFRPIVECFIANGDKYNLLNSAMIELFEFIRAVSLVCSLRWCHDTLDSTSFFVQHVAYVDTIKIITSVIAIIIWDSGSQCGNKV